MQGPGQAMRHYCSGVTLSEELIGRTLRRLNPGPGKQLIVTLVGYRGNWHACRQCDRDQPHMINAGL